MNIHVIADVDPSDVIGGAERMLAGQLNELAKRGHKITVLTRRQDERPVEEDTRFGYRVVRYPMPAGMGISDLVRALGTIRKAVDSMVRQDKPDLLYIQQPLAGAGALLSSRGRRVPSAYQFHSPWSDEYRLRLPRASGNVSDPESLRLTAGEKVKLNVRKTLEGKAIRHANQILVLSKFMRDRCGRLHRIPESKFAIAPGGVDTDHFHVYPNRVSIRSRLRVDADEHLLLSVRNIEPRMGLANLIAAMPAILMSRPNTVCIIGGSGPLLGELKQQAITLNLGDRMRFAGFIPEQELPEYYAAADLFILPTTALEGFGMVTVEALACGTPVMGTPIGATPEILTGLDPALVLAGVEPEDIAGGAVSFLNRSQSTHDELRSKSRSYAIDNYSWTAVVDRIEKLLCKIANQPI